MNSPEVGSPQLTRREAITSGFAGVGLSATATSPLLQFGRVIPSVSRVWMEIGTDGDAEFVAEFDGNVERALYIPGLSKSRLESVATSQGLNLSIEDVSVTTPENIKSKHTLSGTVSDFATIDSTGDRTTASIDLETVDSERLDNLLPIVNIANKAKPERRGFLTVRMPDEFSYSLPLDADRVGPRMNILSEILANEGLGGVPEIPFTGSQIQYNGNDRKLTFPALTHWVNDDLAWIHSTTMLKYGVLEAPGSSYRLVDLYDVDWYGEQAIEDGFGIGAAIANELGKMAIEEVLLSKVPSPISAGLDAKSILSALDPEFIAKYHNNEEGIFSGFLSNSDSSEPPESYLNTADAIDQTNWLREAVAQDRDPRELADHGFGSLWLLTEIERGITQLLATTPGKEGNRDLIEIYLSLLNTQQQIAQTTRINLLRAEGYVNENDEYWRKLHEYALTVCEKIATLSENQATALSEM